MTEAELAHLFERIALGRSITALKHALASVRAEGFAKAREMAADAVGHHPRCPEHSCGYCERAERIRAMQDEGER